MARVIKRKTKSGYSYLVEVYKGRDSNGKRKHEYRTYPSSKVEGKTERKKDENIWKIANDWERSLKKKNAPPLRADKIKYGEIINEWEEHIKKCVESKDLGTRTGGDYIYFENKYCRKYFESMTIEVIDEFVARDFLHYLRDKTNLKRLDSQKKVFASMRKVFSYLVERGIITDNPFLKVKVGVGNRRGEGKGIKGNALDDEQSLLFLQIINSGFEYKYSPRKRKNKKGEEYQVKSYSRIIVIPLKWRALFYVILTGGLRVGEVRGLKWKNIDFSNNKVSIDAAIVSDSLIKKRDDLDLPKTENGIRTLQLPQETIELLREWKKEQCKSAKEMGDAWKGERLKDFDEQYIFSSSDGTIMDKGTPAKKIQDIITKWNSTIKDKIESENDPEKAIELKKLLLPVLTAKDLRHTFGSVETLMGTSVNILTYKMGHGNVATTYNNYVHKYDKKAEEAKPAFSVLFEENNMQGNKSLKELAVSESKKRQMIDRIKEMDVTELEKLYSLMIEEKFTGS